MFSASSDPQQVNDFADFQGCMCNGDRIHAGGHHLLLLVMVTKLQAFALLGCCAV
jgi:hypothetical protein